MKPILFLATIFFINSLSAQYTYTITADTVKLVGADSSELVIGNHTQAVPGFLFNTGRGRTAFQHALIKISDSSYLVGADSLKLRYGQNAWLQGGSRFGAAGKFGTNDKNDIDMVINNQPVARIDTNGFFLMGGILTGSSFKLDVQAPVRFNPSLSVAQSNVAVTFNAGVANAYGTGIEGAQVIFNGATVGTNKTAFGNMPAYSLMLGHSGSGVGMNVVDYVKNPVFVIDSMGIVTINGGYDGIGGGGATVVNGNANSYTFSVNGCRGTGAGIAGDIIFSTGNSQVSGYTIHTMTNRWWIKGNTGYLSNASSPTSSVDLTGANGYSQLGLRTPYTATSTADTNGNTGNISWDDGYLYIKTSSGWKRSALSSF